ncbi:hypothetical protein [Mucilaginibacter sp. SP1R1]|uniref:hypothetical protein n=1 Tax=Mucilaginibacter sp. SP1R1 TaxID=2723091 RepID=UPI0016071A40|nr:hypothetical protein [Mucilaginibacter sp. SP1R1]MBB6151707.1 hypothetical protein [Mucilaginibacter sp. SP1R1]
MKNLNHYFLSVFLSALLCSSCANLDHISNYAAISNKALETQSSIGYSYTQHCLDFDCAQSLYYSPAYGHFQDTVACNCDTYKLADKALITLNSVLAGYLTGLGKLSDKNAVNYNYDDLVKAIDVDKIKSILPITSAQISSAGKIATVITNDLMSAYRQKKLKEIIKKTNPDFQIVIDTYISLMKNQFTVLLIDADKMEITNRYNRYFATEQNLPAYIKTQYYQDYLGKVAKLKSYKDLTERFIAALIEIKKGHQEINDQLDNITTDSIKQLVNKYSADLYTIVQEFNTLKNAK